MKTSELKAHIIEKWLMFRVLCQLKMDALRLDFAIFMADSLQRAKNKRFYVIENNVGKLIWLCNDDIKAMKKPRRVRKLVDGRLRTFKISMLPKNITHLDIMRDCLYYTPIDRNNSNGISLEERNRRQTKWIKYMEKIRMNRIFGKLQAVK
ncbi:MAG: hypothetical protein IJQ84_05910 [Paludibacteraceae bacterium]|nr:hypothetical protein [Paludibacteraceae bacterium]MBR0065387.1 hypothetical protein [Paludibacteraceae bacterium]